MNIKGLAFVVTLLTITNFSIGCSTWNKLDRTEKGAVIGGGTGVAVGNIVAPGVGGTLIGGGLGAAAGGLIGHETDDKKKK